MWRISSICKLQWFTLDLLGARASEHEISAGSLVLMAYLALPYPVPHGCHQPINCIFTGRRNLYRSDTANGTLENPMRHTCGSYPPSTSASSTSFARAQFVFITACMVLRETNAPSSSAAMKYPWVWFLSAMATTLIYPWGRFGSKWAISLEVENPNALCRAIAPVSHQVLLQHDFSDVRPELATSMSTVHLPRTG